MGDVDVRGACKATFPIEGLTNAVGMRLARGIHQRKKIPERREAEISTTRGGDFFDEQWWACPKEEHKWRRLLLFRERHRGRSRGTSDGRREQNDVRFPPLNCPVVSRGGDHRLGVPPPPDELCRQPFTVDGVGAKQESFGGRHEGRMKAIGAWRKSVRSHPPRLFVASAAFGILDVRLGMGTLVVEIAVVAGVGIIALAAVLLAIKLIKVAARAVMTVVIIGAMAVVASTWGRPVLVDAWDRFTSYGDGRAPRGSTPAHVSNLSKQMEENQRVRQAIAEEFRRQDRTNRPSEGVDQTIPFRTQGPGIVRRASSNNRVR